MLAYRHINGRDVFHKVEDALVLTQTSDGNPGCIDTSEILDQDVGRARFKADTVISRIDEAILHDVRVITMRYRRLDAAYLDCYVVTIQSIKSIGVSKISWVCLMATIRI